MNKNKALLNCLPEEIDAYIFNQLGAIYDPDHDAVKSNLSSDEASIKRYLGTYFPRSFIESYNIFSDLLSHPAIQGVLNKQLIRILDIGTGTGGNVLGMLYAFKNELKNFEQKEFEIITIEGNEIASKYCKMIIDLFFPNSCNLVQLHSGDRITCVQDLKDFIRSHNICNLDVVTTFKFVNEMIRETNQNDGFYENLTHEVQRISGEDSIFVLADVTDMAQKKWLPKIINCEISRYVNTKGTNLEPILPIPCAFWQKVGNCPNCFGSKTFYVNSSKVSERSNLYFKVLAKNAIASNILKTLELRKDYIICYKKDGQVIICAGGNTSTFVGQLENHQFFDPYSIRDSMTK